MVERRPLVIIDGLMQELPSGDTTPGSGGGGGGGGSSAVGSHRYWALLGLRGDNGNIQFQAIKFMEGATRHFPTTFIASSEYSSGYQAAYLLNDTGTYWAALGLHAWLYADFGSDVAVDLVSILPVSAALNQAPSQFVVAYSDDARLWTPVISGIYRANLWASGVWVDFDVPTELPGGGGGGSTGTPEIKAYATGLYNGSSVTITLPAGTVEGDLVIVYWENGFSITTSPAGWSRIWVSNNGSLWTNQACIGKIMTAADITAGSVTVGASGGYNGFWAIVTIDGDTAGSFTKMEHFDSAGSANTASAAVSGMLAVSKDDLIVGFASTRSNQTIGLSSGLVSVESKAGANASGIFFTVDPDALKFFGMTEQVTAPVSNNGLAWTTVALKGV